jgi:toxin CcdB
MARFDVYQIKGGGLVLDCQADLFEGIGTRFVVPLSLEGESAPVTPRLHPRFEIGDETLIMMTEFAAAVPTSALGDKIASLKHEHYRIIGAIDVLTGSG